MRDGRRQRLGLGGSITATLNAGEDPGDISTSGIGSLISISDLYNEALAGENATTGNQAYLDRILDEAGPDTLSLDPGAYVDTRDNRYINDAYNYYLGGGTGDFADEVALTGDDTIPNVDTGDGGEDLATSGLGLGDTGTGDLDGLTQSGTFAGNPTFTTTPGTTVDDITGDITNVDGTYAGNIVDEVALTGAAPSGITENSIEVGIPDNESGFVDPLGTISGAPVVGDFSEPTTGTISDDRLNEVIGGQTMAAGPFDYLQEQTPLSQVQVPGLDYSQAVIDAERLSSYTSPSSGTVNEVTDDPTMQETISNAFTSARQNIGSLAEAGVDQIQEIGQSIANTIGGIYNGEAQTISIFGKEINVPGTLAGIALSQVVGAPINIAFGVAKAVGGMLPQYESTFEETTLANELGVTEDGKFAGDPTTSAYAGLNAVSAFGNPVETAQNRIDTRNETIANNPNISQEFIDDTKKMEAEQDKVTDELGDVNPDATPADIDAGVTTGDASVAEAVEAEKQKDAAQEAATTASNAASVSMGADRYSDGGPGGTTGATTGANEDFSDFDEGDTSTADPGGTGDFDGKTGATQDNQDGFGGSCFIAGTKVTMSDGTLKNIEDIQVGDKVKGYKDDNEVIKLDPTLLATRKLYSFNDNNHYFFTSEHPFMTEEGWKSVKPEKTKERDGIELYNQLEGELKIGDKLVTDKGLIEITDIKSKQINKPDMPLYNFNVSNDNSYIADGYVVHNKGGGGGCVIATHAVNSGAFTKDTKREAVRWCVKNLHRTWWGEAIRKGYRYYGQKAIEQGKAKNHYQEFKDYVAFGTGKRRTLKTGWTFVYRTVQFFLRGLTL